MTDRNIATVRNQILLASRFGLSAILRIKYTKKPRYEMEIEIIKDSKAYPCSKEIIDAKLSPTVLTTLSSGLS